MYLWSVIRSLPVTVVVVACALLFYLFLWVDMSRHGVRLQFPTSICSKTEAQSPNEHVRDSWFKWPKNFFYVKSGETNITRMEPFPHTTKESTILGTGKTAPKKTTLQDDTVSSGGLTNANRAATGTSDAAQANLSLIPVLFKAKFEQMPQWEFEDVYNLQGQLSETNCTMSLRHTVDPEFKKAFIPNIQLFMHKKQISISKWNQLSHFNNPYGFMEYNYTDVVPVIDLIPEPETPQLLAPPPGEQQGCVRCAVVGNGGILNGSAMGSEIDSHTYVFRVNGAVTKGYEEDVGSRTSVYVHTAYSLYASLLAFKKYGFNRIPHDQGIKYVMIPEGLRDFKWLQGLFQRKPVKSGIFRGSRPWEYFSEQFDEKRFYVIHPDFLRYIKNRFLKSLTLNGKYWPLYRPSNGAFTLFLALHTCDIVDAYGFMTEDHHKYPNYYFQRSEKTKVIMYINHDFILESKTWKKLNAARVLRLYQRLVNEQPETEPPSKAPQHPSL